MNSALDSNEFEVLSLLGAGGAGSVYKARQISFDRIVAVKVLHATEAASNEQLQRFQREAAMLQNLQHPNIVRLYKFGTTPDSRPYAVLEYLEGKSLQEYLQDKGKLTFAECVPIFEQILDGVGFAHESGIVHRDLKPSNVLLLEAPDTVAAPKVKILDFGLAKPEATVTVDGQKVTKTGAVLGTPLYMSPEQCSAAAVTARSDIYSIGCMLYECVMGQPPFSSDSYYAVLMSQIQDTPPPMPNINDGVQQLIMRALQKNPEERFSSTAEFKDALVLAAQGKHVPSPKPRTHVRRAEKNPKQASQIIGILIAVAAIAGGACAIQAMFTPTRPTLSDDPDFEQDRALHQNDYVTLKKSMVHQWLGKQRSHYKERLNNIATQVADRVRAHFFVHSHWQPDGSEPSTILTDGRWVLEQAETWLGEPEYAHAAVFSSLMLAELDSQDQQIYNGVKIGGMLDSARDHFQKAVAVTKEADTNSVKELMAGLSIEGKAIAEKCMKQMDQALAQKNTVAAAQHSQNSIEVYRSILWLFENKKEPAEALPLYYESAWHYADLMMAKNNSSEAIKYYKVTLEKENAAEWKDLMRVNLVRAELAALDNSSALPHAKALYERKESGHLKTALCSPFLVDFLYGTSLMAAGRSADAVPILQQALKEPDAHTNAGVYELGEKTMQKAIITSSASNPITKKEGRR